jgi:hypothetical protein
MVKILMEKMFAAVQVCGFLLVEGVLESIFVLGYYTRSGYVPGPICKYNWTKVWDVADEHNRKIQPQARIFSYLTVDEGEQFPGHLSCHHRGSLKKLNHGENLISQMSNYFDFLSTNAQNKEGLWTAPYLDDWGLGLMVTYTLPCISQVDNR